MLFSSRAVKLLPGDAGSTGLGAQSMLTWIISAETQPYEVEIAGVQPPPSHLKVWRRRSYKIFWKLSSTSVCSFNFILLSY
jgi:hypothetical protein